METERSAVVRKGGWGRNREFPLKGYGASAWDDEKVLELDSSDVYTTS